MREIVVLRIVSRNSDRRRKELSNTRSLWTYTDPPSCLFSHHTGLHPTCSRVVCRFKMPWTQISVPLIASQQATSMQQSQRQAPRRQMKAGLKLARHLPRIMRGWILEPKWLFPNLTALFTICLLPYDDIITVPFAEMFKSRDLRKAIVDTVTMT